MSHNKINGCDAIGGDENVEKIPVFLELLLEAAEVIRTAHAAGRGL